MHFYCKKQKLFFTALLVLEFFVTNAFPAFAGFLGGPPAIPTPSNIMADIEERLHLNKGTLQDIGETLNTSGSKGNAPEVSLFFTPTDPKAGTKLSVKAFPTYFSVDEKDLYYTWYLKRTGCDLSNSVTDINKLCDADENGKITVEDWKIEAAKIIVQSGYDNADANYDGNPQDDNDGYKAKFGGEGKESTGKNYCYASDATTGLSYEIVDKVVDPFDCSLSYPSNTLLLCVEEGSVLDPITGNYGPGVYTESGKPSCSEGALTCGTGKPYCSSSLTNLTTATMIDASSLSCSPPASANPICSHLFPLSYKLSSGGNVSNNTSSGGKDLKVGETGGNFGVPEERFWGTNPEDPSTADNGNKDEANVVGLGQSSFTWNYDSGDKVGVAVEGLSMNPTKHDNSSYMVMWALPKKSCSVGDLSKMDYDDNNVKIGSYVESIKGYDVNIPAVSGLDLNKCIAWFGQTNEEHDKNIAKNEHDKNLVDPTEGGQATKLSVSVTASPENPINDPGSGTGASARHDKSGDTVVAQATVDNAAQSIANILFDWKVYIGSSISSFNSVTTSKDITSELRDLGLLGNTKGNALDSISLKLDVKDSDISPSLSSYLTKGMGYLKFKVATQESFSGGGIRKGSNDDGVIVKFISSTDSITAYSVVAAPVGDTNKVLLATAPDGGKICFSDPLDRTVCRVIKNEIIGLKVDGTGLSNFNWTINGSPLVCTARVSNDCSLYGEKKAASPPQSTTDDDKKIDAVAQGPTNFFPVTGNLGDTYTVTMTANDIASGKTVTLTRSFNVVEPKVVIKSTSSDAWQKFLGQYKDISGSINPATHLLTCPNELCDDLSESIYQTYSGSSLGFYADFMPDVISGVTTQEWTVDGIAYTPTDWSASTVDPKEKMISIDPADKPAGGVYTINLLAQVVQSKDIRKALLDIWGISPFDSPEINFASSIQVEVQEVLTTEGPLSGPRKYYAAIASYIPASVLFTFRIFLSVVLTLFVLGLLNSLLEERRLEAFVRSFSRSRDK